MAIAPISNVLGVNRNYSVNFGNRKSEKYSGEEYDSRSASSSNLVKVPVIVLLAMSPLNSSSVDSYNQDVNISGIELVQTPPQNPVTIAYLKELTSGNEHIVITGMDKDRNRKNIESLGFNYDITKGPLISKLDGLFFAIANEPETDGRYLIAYKELQKDNKFSKNKICYLPSAFGEQIRMISSFKSNNDAIKLLPKSEFTEYFGEEAVKNAPLMKDAVTKFEIVPQKKD